MKAPEHKPSLSEYLPHGMVATKQWLQQQGVSVHTIDYALKAGKLALLANGVYARPDSSVSWQGIVCSLQKMNTVPYHVGGLSALEYQGLGHYAVISEQQEIHIYAAVTLPGWVKRLQHTASFKWHGTKRLWTDEIMQSLRFVRSQQWQQDAPPVQMSCPEKACLEMLSCVPATVGFEHAGQLLQGMTNLSPGKLEVLLHECLNVKAKRLLFWFGERNNYAWMRKLNVKDFDLGSGKRVIAKSAVLDKKYLITVPKDIRGYG